MVWIIFKKIFVTWVQKLLRLIEWNWNESSLSQLCCRLQKNKNQKKNISQVVSNDFYDNPLHIFCFFHNTYKHVPSTKLLSTTAKITKYLPLAELKTVLSTRSLTSTVWTARYQFSCHIFRTTRITDRQNVRFRFQSFDRWPAKNILFPNTIKFSKKLWFLVGNLRCTRTRMLNVSVFGLWIKNAKPCSYTGLVVLNWTPRFLVSRPAVTTVTGSGRLLGRASWKIFAELIQYFLRSCYL